MDWKFSLLLLFAALTFFSGWQFALWVPPIDFQVAGWVMGFTASLLLMLSYGTRGGA